MVGNDRSGAVDNNLNLFKAVELTFTAFTTLTAGVAYSATLVVQSDDPVTSELLVPVTMNVLSSPYSVDISPDDGLSAAPGETVVYAVAITNTSVTLSDSFTVTLSAASWTTSVDMTQVGPLSPGMTATVHVSVTVPADVVLPAQDVLQVTATSHGDPNIFTTANLTTVAAGVFGVDLEPEVSTGSIRPTGVITYTLRLTNTGELTDTIDLSVMGASSVWVSLPQNSFVLGSGQAVDVFLVVTVPLGATADDYTVEVTAASAHDPAQADTVLVTTMVLPGNIYLPFVSRAP